MMTVVLMLGLMPSGALVAFADDQTGGEGDTVHDSAAIGDADGATSRVIVKVPGDGGATAEEVESQSGGGQVVGQVKDVFVVEYGSADEAAREGTALIYNKLMAYLKTQGLEVIEARGVKFDTDFHEAVTQFPAPSEDLKGMVIDVVQTGYLLNGKILRYAKVVVGA